MSAPQRSWPEALKIPLRRCPSNRIFEQSYTHFFFAMAMLRVATGALLWITQNLPRRSLRNHRRWQPMSPLNNGIVAHHEA
jgi:hypothetical protein